MSVSSERRLRVTVGAVRDDQHRRIVQYCAHIHMQYHISHTQAQSQSQLQHNLD